MRRFIAFIVVLVFFASACKKDDVTQQAEIDEQIILDYLADHQLEATEHESGVYYIITKHGTGGNPNLTHTVVVYYKGYLTNGVVFDESTNAIEMKMTKLINGFQIAVSLLKSGGKGTFLIPSQLAYGDKGVGEIPANAVLIFDLELVEFY